MTATDIPDALEAEFNAWYDSEHVPWIAAIPGVTRAARYRALQGPTRYVSIYHLSAPSAYQAESWQRANATPWTQRMRASFLSPRSFIFERDPS